MALVFAGWLNGAGALAAEPDWYAGAAGGISTLDITRADWDDGSLLSGAVDDKGLAYKIFTGHRFSSHIAMELSYLRLGYSTFDGEASGNVPSVWKPGFVFGETDAQGVSVEARADWTLRQRFRAQIKGGLFFWDSTVIYEPTIAATSVVDDPDQSNRSVIHDDGVSFIYGVGAELRVYKNWWLRAEWQQTKIGLVKTDVYNVNMISLGAQLAF